MWCFQLSPCSCWVLRSRKNGSWPMERAAADEHRDAPAAEPRRSQLQAGIFRAAGTWTPPARSGLDNSVNLLSGR